MIDVRDDSDISNHIGHKAALIQFTGCKEAASILKFGKKAIAARAKYAFIIVSIESSGYLRNL